MHHQRGQQSPGLHPGGAHGSPQAMNASEPLTSSSASVVSKVRAHNPYGAQALPRSDSHDATSLTTSPCTGLRVAVSPKADASSAARSWQPSPILPRTAGNAASALRRSSDHAALSGGGAHRGLGRLSPGTRRVASPQTNVSASPGVVHDARDNDSDVHSVGDDEHDEFGAHTGLPAAAVVEDAVAGALEETTIVGRQASHTPHPPPVDPARRSATLGMSDAASASRMSPGLSFNANLDTPYGLEATDRTPFAQAARWHPSPSFPIAGLRASPHAGLGRTPHIGPKATPSAAQRLPAVPTAEAVTVLDGEGPCKGQPLFGAVVPKPSPSAPPAVVNTHREQDHGSVHDRTETTSRTDDGTLSSEGRPALSAERLTALIAGELKDVACPSGFSITVYSGDISQHFVLPSEDVQISRGSIKYVDHLARYGAQMRFRFQLCHNYLLRKCPKLSECSYIHATKLPAPSQVHLNPFAPRRLAADRHGRSSEVPYAEVDDPAVADRYETMPPNATFVVFAPHGNQVTTQETTVSSHLIIRTAGADEAWAYMLNPSSAPPGYRPRHCAHFQFKRVCNHGRSCPLIHSKLPFAGTVVGLPVTASGAPMPPQVGHQGFDPGRKPLPLDFTRDSDGTVRPKLRGDETIPTASDRTVVIPTMNAPRANPDVSTAPHNAVPHSTAHPHHDVPHHVLHSVMMGAQGGHPTQFLQHHLHAQNAGIVGGNMMLPTMSGGNAASVHQYTLGPYGYGPMALTVPHGHVQPPSAVPQFHQSQLGHHRHEQYAQHLHHHQQQPSHDHQPHHHHHYAHANYLPPAHHQPSGPSRPGVLLPHTSEGHFNINSVTLHHQIPQAPPRQQHFFR
jgi:hypothetical protein